MQIVQEMSNEDMEILLEAMYKKMEEYDTKESEAVIKAKNSYDKLTTEEQRAFRKMCGLKIMSDNEYEHECFMDD